MKAKFLIICFLATLFVSDVAFSQKSYFSFGGEVALPLSAELKEYADFGFGGAISFEFFSSNHVVIQATTEYFSCLEKRDIIDEFINNKVRIISAQIGLKYYPKIIEEIPKGFFISGEIGVAVGNTTSYYIDGGKAYNDDTWWGRGLSLSPGIGYQFGKFESSFRFVFSPKEAFQSEGFYYLNFRVSYAIIRK